MPALEVNNVELATTLQFLKHVFPIGEKVDFETQLPGNLYSYKLCVMWVVFDLLIPRVCFILLLRNKVSHSPAHDAFEITV